MKNPALLAILPTFIFACTEPTEDFKATWHPEDVEGTRLLVQRHDTLLDRITFRGERLAITEDIVTFDIQEVRIPLDADIDTVIGEMLATGEYNFVEPVLIRELPPYTMTPAPIIDAVRSPNDPYYPYQFNMMNIQADQLTASSQGTGVTVAVIDTGVYTTGTDTPINLLTGYDFVNDDNDANDDQGHGTHVAGTIAQATNNGVGVMGITPDANILPIKVLDANGSGFSTDTILGIEFAVQNGADVINMSLGSSSSSTSEENAVTAALNAGVAVVAANGNDGIKTNGVLYPAAYPGVVAVSATDFEHTITGYSNAGPETVLSAPGGDTGLDFNNDGIADGIIQEAYCGSWTFCLYDGTSMATPHVAGAFAAMMSEGASATEAQYYLELTSVDYGDVGEDDLYGVGEIRIKDAVDAYLNDQSNNGGGSTTVSSLGVGDLIISEIMPDPTTVADYRGEWFEIYNNTANTINLNGLIVDSSGNAGFTVSSDVEIAAGEYAVFAVRTAYTGNGGLNVDYTYNYGDVSFNYNDSLTISSSSTVIDSVSFTEVAFGVLAGSSISTTSLDESANNTAANWCAATTSYGYGDFGTPGAANDTCPTYVSIAGLSAGDLIISEIMMDPAMVADYRGEWIEIYNNTADDINLNGLQVTSNSDSGFTISGTVVLPSSGYVVLAAHPSESINGGLSNVDYAYNFSAFRLTANDRVSVRANGSTIDTVYYTISAFPVTEGTSMTLGTLGAAENDSAIYWCNSTSTYGDGDLGTPGADNDVCEPPPATIDTLGAGDLVISELMPDPNAVADYRGEWIEIYNNSGSRINLKNLVVNSNGQNGFSINTDLIVEIGDYALLATETGSSINGGMDNVDFRYAYFDLRLLKSTNISLSANGTTIDSMTYDATYPSFAGISMTLGTLSATANDSNTEWCAATSSYGDGDLGTPGMANDGCP